VFGTITQFVVVVGLPRQHPVEQRVRLPLLVLQLLGAVRHDLLEVVGVLLHHGHHVVHHVSLPTRRLE